MQKHHLLGGGNELYLNVRKQTDQRKSIKSPLYRFQFWHQAIEETLGHEANTSALTV